MLFRKLEPNIFFTLKTSLKIYHSYSDEESNNTNKNQDLLKLAY